ncbi:heat shock protein transcriptional repressor HspR [Scrofimicrobium sp. R131]|uniref:Helix-turn-helix transcriptional regulator n=1 Tax=Scrofimicrobium appendicitidis TaxID=3079930 RepID=A0AAU7V7J2_9ACTO
MTAASSPSEAVYVISVAAELAGMHPQTLRQYDRLGLVSPQRTKGRGRRYSPADIQRLRHVQALSQDEGVNLAGIRRIMHLERQIEELNRQIEVLSEQVHSAPIHRVFTADSHGFINTRSPQAPVPSRPTGRGELALSQSRELEPHGHLYWQLPPHLRSLVALALVSRQER